MAAALRLFLLALAAGAAAGPAAVRLKTGDPAHHHRYFEGSRRLLYVSGEYPSKTRLGVFDAASGTARSFHFAEQRLTGPFVYFEDRDQALVEALERPGEGDEPGLLRAGKVLRDFPTETGFDAVVAGPGGLLAHARLPGEATTVLYRLDPSAGTARELDRRTGEFWGADRQSWFLGLLAAAVLLGIVMAILMRPACKSCG